MFLSKSDLQDLQTGFVDYIKDSCSKKQPEPTLLPKGSFCVTVQAGAELTLNFEITRKMQEVSCVKNILLHVLPKIEEL